MGSPAADRAPALDALRAAMMLAVVVLHAAVFYGDVSVGRLVFKFSDPDGGPGFFWLAVLLQAVSMPAFFVAAGFSVAVLTARRGPRAMLAHRLRRVTLPFLVFWPVLYAVTMGGMLFGCAAAPAVTVAAPDDPGAVLRHIGVASAAGTPFADALELRWPPPTDTLVQVGTRDGSEAGPPVFELRGPPAPPGTAAGAAARFVPVAVGVFFRPSTNHLIHLWFLWVLTLLAAAAAALAPLVARAPTAALAGRLGGFAFPFVLAVPLAGVFFAHQLPAIPPPPSLLVPPATLAGYGVFFAAGALLGRYRERLPQLGRHAPLHLALGLAAWVGGWVLTPAAAWSATDPAPAAVAARVGACAGAALGHALLAWGCVGAFVRLVTKEVRWVRYVSAASYWVYLVHLPVVVWAAAALVPWEASRFVKFPVVLALGLGAPLATYHAFVRRTTLGAFLNGRPPLTPPTPAPSARG